MLTLRWIGTIRDWVATAAARRRRQKPASDPLSSALVLRMDEFTSKDLALRSEIVRAALVHFRVIGDARAEIGPALAVFAVNSQAGSKMSGPKAAIVTAADVGVIKRCVAQALGELGGVAVEVDGANIALRGCLGIDCFPWRR